MARQNGRQNMLPGRTFPLFTIFGFEVKLNLSWLLLALLITWTLAEGFFPQRYPELSATARWWMGIAGAAGILFSIVFHELSHSLVARLYGLKIGGISLFMFGGVAEMRHEPGEPKVEFLMAGAGPLSSLVLAGLMWMLHALAVALAWPLPITGILFYLAFINVAVAVFNLVPAYPLDGGRMLRAGLWAWRGDMREATRIASTMGTGFGLLLALAGLLAIVGGAFVAGMWWILIGLFIRGAARASWRQQLLQQMLEGRSLRDFMEPDPVTVTRDISLRRFVEDYVYRHHARLFPVVDGGRLAGCATVDELKRIPESEWEERAVAEITRPCSGDNTIEPDTPPAELASRLFGAGSSSERLVVENGRLLGTVSLNALADQLALRMELERPGGTLRAG